MIPKLFHRIWFGGKPMFPLFAEWGESWLKHHPDWTMKTWTEEDVSNLDCVDILKRCSCLAQMSDVARYEILLREGGLYIDTDIECLRPIDSLIKDYDFFGCWVREGSGILSNALIGSVPGHLILADLVQETPGRFKPEPWDIMGPPFFTEIVKRHGLVKVFSQKTFMPYSWLEYKNLPEKPIRNLPPLPDSYAVNHRSSIWFEDSYKRF